MKTVLIVDDEQIVLDVLRRILSKFGYDTVAADSGELALERFSREAFDLVLMDVLMPDMKGFRIGREMRRIRPDQKIVMMTGICKNTVEAQANLEDIDVDNVLLKPFSFEKVKSVLKEVLDGGEAF